jgi:hypothetical protein
VVSHVFSRAEVLDPKELELPMPAKKPTHEAMPSKELVLAAIERAERHRIKLDDPSRYKGRPDRPGVMLATVKQHLGLAHGGWTTIQLRPCWDGLKATGLIEKGRRAGFDVWRLTSTGQQCLDRARKAGDIGQLPEAPQHREWREARTVASGRIDAFREELQAALGEAAGILDAHETPDSDTWYAIGQRLTHACKRLETASYCLHEWQEPDDAHADIAPQPLKNRRNIRLADSH